MDFAHPRQLRQTAAAGPAGVAGVGMATQGQIQVFFFGAARQQRLLFAVVNFAKLAGIQYAAVIQHDGTLHGGRNRRTMGGCHSLDPRLIR